MLILLEFLPMRNEIKIYYFIFIVIFIVEVSVEDFTDLFTDQMTKRKFTRYDNYDFNYCGDL